MTESTSAIEQAVAARIAAARRRSEDMLRQRAELAAARRAGLAKRHAAKLRNQAARQQEASIRTADGTAEDSTSPSNDRVNGWCGNSPQQPATQGASYSYAAHDLRGPDDHADVTETDTTAEEQA